MVQELSTLELANDCHRFVAAFFEIIRASSPHIYHSALALTPKTSIVRKLYESHSHPFVRIVRGVSESWDSNTAAATFPFNIGRAVWSPCNRFIAITPWDAVRVDILDSATLQRLQSLGPLGGFTQPAALIFSPGNRMLTYSSHKPPHSSITSLSQEMLIVTWDLQTGRRVSTIEWSQPYDPTPEKPHITYSMDGGKVAILSSWYRGAIFDVISGVYMHDIDCHQPYGYRLCHIWTHGESIRFATSEPTGICIWEVGFAPGDRSVKLKVLPGSEDLTTRTNFGSLPALDRVALADTNPAPVWDSQDSKSLLHHTDLHLNPLITFSSGRSFFTCLTAGSVIYLWENFPKSYIFERVPSAHKEILFSPNGKLFITFFGNMVRLWHMNNVTSASPSLSDQPMEIRKFIIDFIPDRSLAVVVRQEDNMITVLDLNSGVSWFTIETPIKVYGLGMNKNTIVAIGCDKAIAWNMPGENPLPNASLDIDIRGSAQIIDLSGDHMSGEWEYPSVVAMSLDFRYIALIVGGGGILSLLGQLCVYSASTGKYLDGTTTSWAGTLWFSPSGDDIWYASGDKAEVWTITEEKLVHKMVIDNFDHGSQECPWRSSCSYQITHEGWILSPDGNRLLMLPPLWQSYQRQRVWNGQFLALLHYALPEPVIIEVKL